MLHDLQLYLRDTGRYAGAIDGIYGRQTRSAILTALEDGPDTALTEHDYRMSAMRLGVKPWAIMAFAEVEAAGAGFQAGKPKLLFEPHRFARATKNRFNGTHPTISYSKWGARPYPRTQNERYEQLLVAVGLDIAAGFSSASYGKFQILGENHAACGYDNSWSFAFAQAYDECKQLEAFESFIRNAGLLPDLKACHWADVAKRYNGPAYFKNRYDVKLAQAARRWEMKLSA